MGLVREGDPILIEEPDDMAQRYAAVCDVLWRFHCEEKGWDEPDDGLMHTSAECRRWANRVFDALWIEAV